MMSIGIIGRVMMMFSCVVCGEKVRKKGKCSDCLLKPVDDGRSVGDLTEEAYYFGKRGFGKKGDD